MNQGLHAALTDQIVSCGIEVHKHLGPGLFESVYESALCLELTSAGLSYKRQIGVPLYYKGHLLSEHLVVQDAVIIEVKAVESVADIYLAQMLTYLRVTGLRVGLVLNFNTPVLARGIRRVSLYLCAAVSLWPLTA